MAEGNGNGLTNGYYILSPEGKKVPVDKRVFEAFQKFVAMRLQGSITVDFISGGVRGVKDETVYR
jgi:hypothetical protein